VKYQQHRVPLVVLAGKDYGMGSSAATGRPRAPTCWACKAVIAESYERIHRSNLIGMGVLPLQFLPARPPIRLGLNGRETFSIAIADDVKPLSDLQVTATARGRHEEDLHGALPHRHARSRSMYYRNGGILHTVLRRLANS
jgi:aconitate hydratase